MATCRQLPEGSKLRAVDTEIGCAHELNADRTTVAVLRLRGAVPPAASQHP